MKRINRILKNSEFKTIISKGKKVNSQTFTIYHVSSEFLKLGVIVSKKNYPLAVDRNKIKRQVKEIFLKNVDKAIPYKIVVMVKKEFHNKPFIVNSKTLLDKINNIG